MSPLPPGHWPNRRPGFVRHDRPRTDAVVDCTVGYGLPRAKDVPRTAGLRNTGYADEEARPTTGAANALAKLPPEELNEDVDASRAVSGKKFVFRQTAPIPWKRVDYL